MREEEGETIQIKQEETELSVFAYGIIIHVENSTESILKLLEVLNEFSKLSECKIDFSKSTIFDMLVMNTLTSKF